MTPTDIIYNILFIATILGLCFWWANITEKYKNRENDEN